MSEKNEFSRIVSVKKCPNCSGKLDAIRNQLATPPVHRRIKSLHARARIGSGKLLSMLLFQSVTKVR